ncbi:YciI family protein [Georgenia sp. SYP-B2076]|uniref:YciI family protein n=1 Tax=Georgenia sp. SYP-B2076 TaxID=2495881 RepID=UPI000F8DDF59|nr:YciI family protein [Georgenia sp. SYP-B2076]
MRQYLLSVYQPDGDAPPPEVLDPIMADLARVAEDMRAAGVWVFSVGLHPPGSATVVRATSDDVLVTDGPYAEGKEHIGGFTIIRAPDLDVALSWAGRIARAATLPVEVRPLAGEVVA